MGRQRQLQRLVRRCKRAGAVDVWDPCGTSGSAAFGSCVHEPPRPSSLHVRLWQLQRFISAPPSATHKAPPIYTPCHAFSTQQSSKHEPRETSASQAAAVDRTQPAPAPSWLARRLPPALLPYAQLMRLENAIGTWLLAWPCFWSIGLAAPPGALPDLTLLALFGAGAVLLRGAGCTVNDLWDRELDRKVARTRTRPLAAGTVSPLQAVGFLGGQLLLGLGILTQLNPYSIALGASSLVLVFTYPAMKRITFWPQAVLGLTFNWGALLGWAAVHGSCEWAVVLPLYAGGACWTLVYDTIYAHQDKNDDAAAGVKSTALLFGSNTKAWLTGFAASSVGLIGLSGYMVHAGVPFYLGIAGAGAHMGWQIKTVDLDSRADCMAKFVSNKWLGGIIFAGIVADKLLTS